MPTTLILAPSDFQTFLRPCSINLHIMFTYILRFKLSGIVPFFVTWKFYRIREKDHENEYYLEVTEVSFEKTTSMFE